MIFKVFFLIVLLKTLFSQNSLRMRNHGKVFIVLDECIPIPKFPNGYTALYTLRGTRLSFKYGCDKNCSSCEKEYTVDLRDVSPTSKHEFFPIPVASPYIDMFPLFSSSVRYLDRLIPSGMVFGSNDYGTIGFKDVESCQKFDLSKIVSIAYDGLGGLSKLLNAGCFDQGDYYVWCDWKNSILDCNSYYDEQCLNVRSNLTSGCKGNNENVMMTCGNLELNEMKEGFELDVSTTQYLESTKIVDKNHSMCRVLSIDNGLLQGEFCDVNCQNCEVEYSQKYKMNENVEEASQIISLEYRDFISQLFGLGTNSLPPIKKGERNSEGFFDVVSIYGPIIPKSSLRSYCFSCTDFEICVFENIYYCDVNGNVYEIPCDLKDKKRNEIKMYLERHGGKPEIGLLCGTLIHDSHDL